MKILIAEDNAFYRMMLEATLVEWGYEVQSVSDGAAAWEILREPNAPKLAILDWVMPVMDGTEVCAKVREISRPRAHLPHHPHGQGGQGEHRHRASIAGRTTISPSPSTARSCRPG